MENLDLTAVARMGLILAHLLAFAAAFAAVAFGDFAIFRRRRVDTELLTKAAHGPVDHRLRRHPARHAA